jgi:hypothetical protein
VQVDADLPDACSRVLLREQITVPVPKIALIYPLLLQKIFGIINPSYEPSVNVAFEPPLINFTLYAKG